MEEANTLGSDSRTYGSNFPANYSVAVSIFTCPSRGRQNPQPNGGIDSFNWSYNQTWTQPPNPLPPSSQPTSPASTPLLTNSWSKPDYSTNSSIMPNITPVPVPPT